MQYPEDMIKAALVDQVLGGVTDFLDGYVRVFYNPELEGEAKVCGVCHVARGWVRGLMVAMPARGRIRLQP